MLWTPEFQTLWVYYDEAATSKGVPAVVSSPIAWDDAGTYYVEVSYSGVKIYGDVDIQPGLIADGDGIQITALASREEGE